MLYPEQCNVTTDLRPLLPSQDSPECTPGEARKEVSDAPILVLVQPIVPPQAEAQAEVQGTNNTVEPPPVVASVSQENVTPVPPVVAAAVIEETVPLQVIAALITEELKKPTLSREEIGQVNTKIEPQQTEERLTPESHEAAKTSHSLALRLLGGALAVLGLAGAVLALVGVFGVSLVFVGTAVGGAVALAGLGLFARTFMPETISENPDLAMTMQHV